MDRTQTEDAASSYYPPRARWYRGIFRVGFAVRRGLHLERLHLPGGITPFQFLVSLIVPGFSFMAHGRRMIGWLLLAAYVLLGLVLVVALGFPLATLALGLVISAHAISIFYLELQWLRDSGFGVKVLCALSTLFVVGLGIYWPAMHYVGEHWFMPLRMKDRVVIVQYGRLKDSARRGDWVVYSLAGSASGDAHGGGAVQVESGFGYGPVLATAGDRVEFSTNSFSVNGVTRPLLRYMPTAGEVVVPEKHWFVWPELAISINRNVGDAAISDVMLKLAVVPESRFIGRPFKHWFGRRQPFS
jgi:hypothetical protein